MWREKGSSSWIAQKPGPSVGRVLLLLWAVSLALFVAGTVTVLSTVKWYLAFPSGAFITEEEVPWRIEDSIDDSLGAAWAEDDSPVAQKPAYWLETGWDGRVRDTTSWERLYNVTTR